MTDTSSLLITQSTPQLLPVTATSLASPTLNGSLSDTLALEDDEPYTIKCICAFADDDGNTVFCEKCETWQHIECYYQGKKVPEIHNCADCEPRVLDARRATERQRKLREQPDGGDRKPKRPASKTHKKKIKDTAAPDQTNGWHERQESASVGRDLPPPAKRPKTNHRTSNSVNSANGTPILHSESRKRATSSAYNYPSPTISPNNHYPPMPMYTQEFLHLYDHDEGKDNLGLKNNFNTISVAGKLKAWLSDPMQLAQDTHGLKHHEVFTSAESDAIFEQPNLPYVSQHTKINDEVDYDGRYPRWEYLVLDTPVRKDDIVGEIKGSVGHFEEYCLDGANRWQELRHPEPFVFFHPQLPIYIDSRSEGTHFRYLRRSCRPNVTMKTFITSDTEYHFCFVAKDDISAGSELTASWYLDQNVFNKSGFVKEEQPNEGDPDPPWLWVSRVLANFGDCACDGTQRCPFAYLDKRHQPRTVDGKHMNGKKRGKRRKRIGSPLVAGTTGSRAGSENVKTQDDDEADSRSTSGSIRSKPQSRDMTPTGGVLDQPTLLTGLSDREKRKIAMAEKNFERLEQDQHGQKKKKRPSGGSTLNTPSVSASVSSDLSSHPHQPDLTRQKQLGQPTSLPSTPSALRPNHIDPDTAAHHSISPAFRLPLARSGKSASPAKRSLQRIPQKVSYVDTAMQTEQDVPEIADVHTPSTKRRKFTPLTQRLLRRCFEDRKRQEQLSPVSYERSALGKIPISPVSSNPMDVQIQDVEMKDVAISASTSPSPSLPQRAPTPPPDQPSALDNSTSNLPPPPLPSQAAHTAPARRIPTSENTTRLSLGSLPPVPSFSSTASRSTLTGTAPSPASVARSPLTLSTSNLTPSASYPGLSTQSPIVAPSPVKKKLSLGDYMSRRSASMTAPATEKAAAAAAVAAASPSGALGTSLNMMIAENGMKRPSDAAIENGDLQNDPPQSATIPDPSLDSGTTPFAPSSSTVDIVASRTGDVEMLEATGDGKENALPTTAEGLNSTNISAASRDPRLR
ncbi:MAG: hypothetical protein Q9227_004804 [Pyrenula ochraceoflavens]